MYKKKDFIALGKIHKREKINGNEIMIVDGINSIHNDKLNNQVVFVKYPDGRKWYHRKPRKNQDINKLYEREKKFIKSCKY